jgi:hypothetical protein
VSGLDGEDLINRIFGGKAPAAASLDDARRQAYRNLFSGLYGAYRNRHAHSQHVITLSEADGIISIINQLLREIDEKM